MTEKRSDTAGIARIDSHVQGVGARQPTPAAPLQGGGYLKIYTFFEFDQTPAAEPPTGRGLSLPAIANNRLPETFSAKNADPRLRQFKEMGLSYIWQEVAATIGYDNFIEMWKILDKHSCLKRPDGSIAANIRAFRSQQRYQRDRFAVLVKRQSSGAEAVKRTEQQMCEKVGISHISRAQEKFRLK